MGKLLLSFKNGIGYDELLQKLKVAGITLSEKQAIFAKTHLDHAGLSIDNSRLYCRTCNVRDT